MTILYDFRDIFMISSKKKSLEKFYGLTSDYLYDDTKEVVEIVNTKFNKQDVINEFKDLFTDEDNGQMIDEFDNGIDFLTVKRSHITYALQNKPSKKNVDNNKKNKIIISHQNNHRHYNPYSGSKTSRPLQICRGSKNNKYQSKSRSKSKSKSKRIRKLRNRKKFQKKYSKRKKKSKKRKMPL